jgi:hypothetical protein
MISLVTMLAGVEYDSMRACRESLLYQLAKALLPRCLLRMALDGRGINVHFDGHGCDGIGNLAPSSRRLAVNMELALARQAELAQIAAQLTNVSGVDVRGGEKIAVASARLVDKHLYGHILHPGRPHRQKCDGTPRGDAL